MQKKLLQYWQKSLPPVLLRSQWETYRDIYGLPLTQGYLAQLGHKGEGPKYDLVGNRACYLRDDFLEWLTSRQSKSLTQPINKTKKHKSIKAKRRKKIFKKKKHKSIAA